jgi:hypothetical protein
MASKLGATGRGATASSDDLIGRVEAIQKRVAASKPKSAPVASVPAQLPLWDDSVRGLPNPLARSALFTVGNRCQKRMNIKDKVVASLQGVKISYQGEELRQDDEDAFLQLLHICRKQPLGEPVEFKAYAMLTELKWGRSSRSYQRLQDSIRRLKACSLTVATEDGKRGFTGSLIRKFAWKEDEDGAPMTSWRLWLEPELVNLFKPDLYTQVYWDQRLALTSPMAKWLHGYFYTHKEPYPNRVELLKTLTGSSAKTKSDFRRQLRPALDALKNCGFLEDWHIDTNDVVRVKRSKSNQRGSLEQRAMTSC